MKIKFDVSVFFDFLLLVSFVFNIVEQLLSSYGRALNLHSKQFWIPNVLF